MPFLGKRSLQNLSEATWYLQKIIQRSITKVDFSIIDCHRPKVEQEIALAAGNSFAKYGESPHNYLPSYGIDRIPSPFKGWEDKVGFLAIKEADLESLAELKAEGEIPDDFELVHGIDWGWDSPHTEDKNWRKKR